MKKKFEMENFLKLDIDSSDISNFARLRISNSILMIGKGRHRKIDLENRLCPLCNFEVEDELHFTKKCTKLQELRNKFYQKTSDILPSFYNLSDSEIFHLIFRSNAYDVSKCFLKGISEMHKFRCSLTQFIPLYISLKYIYIHIKIMYCIKHYI